MGDLRFAWRGLSKNPGFTFVAAFSLALGIGAATALFSVIYGVLISPYPYKEPEKIWSPHIQSVKGDDEWATYGFPDFQKLEKLPAFSEVMATMPDSDMLLTGDFAPQTFRAVRVTGGAFQFLGVRPVIGRGIQPTDFLSTGEGADVIVLSFRMWQKLFAGDAAALGKTLRLNDHSYQVIGVMPPRFGWWTGDGFWMPLGREIEADGRNCVPIARLKEGATAAAAETQLHALHESMAKENPGKFPKDGFRSRLVNYLDMTVASGEMQKTLWLLFGAVVLLLLIACANVANLSLARGSARAREMAIRVSMGADRARLIRQLLTESVLLSTIGGVAGVLLAFWTTRAIVALMPPFYVPNEARIAINGWVLLFSVAVSMVTAIFFGLAPALQASKVDLTDGLKDSGKGSGASIHGGNTRKALVVVEVALSVVLLVAAALMVRTFLALENVELGFRPENVIAGSVQLPAKRYATLEQRNRFGLELLERVKRIPGVTSASIGNGGTPFNGLNSPVTLEGRADGEERQMNVTLASAEYLSAMRIPLIDGREFTEREVADGAPIGIVNQAALKFWPAGENPVGRRIKLDFLQNPGRALKREGAIEYVTIVGVMGDTRAGLRRGADPVVILPFTLIAPTGRTIVLRTTAEPAVVFNSVRAQLGEMDKEQPFGEIGTMGEVVARQMIQPRFTMALFAAFALIGLALAAVGIYSVLSFFVTRRTHEIGVRMALGAQWKDILQLVLATGGKLVGSGLAVGLIAGFAVTRLLQSHVFGVTTADPISYGAGAVVLAAIGFLACYVPARRAARVNPTEALRYE
jgi:putative ABC transport system permease protein